MVALGEVDMQRILTALGYAVVALVGAYQASGPPATAEAWGGLIVLAITTFWGKYSSSTTVIAPNRQVFTPEERAAKF